jgi:DNA-binding transcriptional LysR family regulator
MQHTQCWRWRKWLILAFRIPQSGIISVFFPQGTIMLDALRIFCVAADSVSFKAAAIRLAISPQQVSRAVQSLEQQTGELLFYRNTRHIQLTQFGVQFSEQAKVQLQQLDALLGGQLEHPQQQRGVVRLTAPTILRPLLTPLLIEFVHGHPEIEVDMRFSDQHAAVVQEQIDIGIRIGVIREPGFIAKQVGQVDLWFVASPALISADTMAELATLDVDGFRRIMETSEKSSLESSGDVRVASRATVTQNHAAAANPRIRQPLPVTGLLDASVGRAWPWYLVDGQLWQPRHCRLLFNDAFAELSAVIAGCGITQTARLLVTAHCAAAELVRLMPQLEPAAWPLSIYRPQRGPVPLRIRLLFDFLQQHLQQQALLQPEG